MTPQIAGEQKRNKRVNLETLRQKGKNMGYKTGYGCTVYLYQRHEYYVNDVGEVFTAAAYHRQVVRFLCCSVNPPENNHIDQRKFGKQYIDKRFTK